MIIFISPAKTFHITQISYNQKPFFYRIAKALNKELKALSILDISSKMKVSTKLAEQIKYDYETFDKANYAAIFSYYGHQYKNLDIDTLYPKYKGNISKLYILSGLYGILNAFDDISHYRLEMENKTIKNLYTYWKPKVTKYIKTYHHDQTIINLCSDEYGKLIKDLEQTITIDFYQRKNNQLSIHSMEVKKMRGLFTRHLLSNDDVDIKKIVIDGYIFDQSLSDHHHYLFIKEA